MEYMSSLRKYFYKGKRSLTLYKHEDEVILFKTDVLTDVFEFQLELLIKSRFEAMITAWFISLLYNCVQWLLDKEISYDRVKYQANNSDRLLPRGDENLCAMESIDLSWKISNNELDLKKRSSTEFPAKWLVETLVNIDYTKSFNRVESVYQVCQYWCFHR